MLALQHCTKQWVYLGFSLCLTQGGDKNDKIEYLKDKIKVNEKDEK